jgi:hypothetical protein
MNHKNIAASARKGAADEEIEHDCLRLIKPRYNLENMTRTPRVSRQHFPFFAKAVGLEHGHLVRCVSLGPVTNFNPVTAQCAYDVRSHLFLLATLPDATAQRR